MKKLLLTLSGFGFILILGASRVTAQSGDASIDFTSCPASVVVGAPITYNLTASILNQQLSGGLTVTDVLPLSLTNVTASAANHADHTTPLCVGVSFCTVNSGGVTCNLPDTCMDDDADADDVPLTDDYQTMTISATAPSVAGPITVTSHASAINPDPNPLNNDATCTTQITAPGAPNVAALSITKDASANVVVLGTNVTFTLTVQNAGQLDAANVVVTDNLPAQLSFVSVTSSVGSCSGTSSITCNLGTVANGASATVTIVANTLALGNVTNTANVTSTTPDNTLADNTASATIQVIAAGADLFIEKLASQNPIPVGTNLTYTLYVSNFGPATAATPVVTDVLPSGVTFVSASVQAASGGASMGSCSGTSTITCNLVNILSGNNATITIVVTPTVVGTLSNTTSVASTTPDPVPSNNSSTVVVQVTGAGTGNPVPTITSISPTSTAAGGTDFFLTVNGTNFVTFSTVTWNGSPRATNFISATQLTADITMADIANPGTASIAVVNPAPGGGTSNSVTFTITSGNTGNPVPTLTSLLPASATAGGAAFTLNAVGTNFVNGAVLEWNGTARTTTFVSSTQLSASISATDIANPGNVSVLALNPAPGGGASNALNFTINSSSGPSCLLDHVAVSPSTLQTITVMQTANFTATAFDSCGNVITGATFSWSITSASSDNSTISAAGVFAPTASLQASKLYTVTATYSGKSGTGQVSVVVGSGSGGDLANVLIGPVPFKANVSAGGINFKNLPSGTRIRLFTISGRLVQTINVPAGGNIMWDIKNASGNTVASGVYLYIIDANGQTKKGKLVVIE
jgi:uncharacterized repeat protein (TIGR01451 family)